MLRFTKQVDYGLMAMQYIAGQQGDGVVGVKRIAGEFRIPPERLAKILQRLAKGGLVISHGGPRGGYRLARPTSEITIDQVIRILDGPIVIVSCMRITTVRRCHAAACGSRPGRSRRPSRRCSAP